MAASVQSILFTAAEVSKQQNQIKSSDAIQNTHNPMVRRTNWPSRLPTFQKAPKV